MNSTKLGANSIGARLAALLGSASLLTLASAAVYAQEQQVAQAELAQADEIPETVLITGSLIRGTAAVGVPVINLAPQDFAEVGALTVADLFRTVPQAVVGSLPNASSAAGNQERAVRVNLRGLDSTTGTRSLFLVDGSRHPAQTTDACTIDPSIIPALAVERIDLLVDGASATYGSDAVGGVLNIILKRNYDGATTQLRYTTGAGGERRYQASAVWGRTWDGGGVVLTYEWHQDTPAAGNFHSQNTIDHTPWGLVDRTPIGSSIPGTISRGAPLSDPLVNHGNTSAGSGNSAAGTAGGGRFCTNCYAIPLGTGINWDGGASGVGPLTPSSGATLAWNGTTFINLSGAAAGYGADGTLNVTNPLHLGWYTTYQEGNRAVITVDQRLTSNISFYGEGYYSNRRSRWLTPPHISFTENATLTMPVPTFNPYYPTGTGVPNNLRVSWTTITERQTQHPAHGMDARYLFGLNFGLPAGWAGEAHWAYSLSRSYQQIINGAPNKNAVSAALGWTIAAQGAVGTTPGIAAWTKPANVPYLNLFCDPTAFTCNAPETLDYIMGYRTISTNFAVNEKAGRVDGPLFELPGGIVKAALGASYTTYNFGINQIDTRQSPNLIPQLDQGAASRAFWAAFTQVNMPLIGDANSLPFVRALELEFSWRHDQYSDVGGTSNAKVAFNWTINDDLTIRGGWGQSFRAPSFGETSEEITFTTNAWNLPPAYAPTIGNIRIACTGGVPNAGSGADKTTQIFGPSVFGCNSNLAPGGLQVGGSNTGARTHGVRDIVNENQQFLEPELAVNWSLGFDYAPNTILQGLSIQATWYKLKVNGVITSTGVLNAAHFNEPANGFRYTIPQDLGCVPPAPGPNPAPPPVDWCEPFAKRVDLVLADPRSVPIPTSRSLIYWIVDTATMNLGYEQVEGIDWQASYDWEWGDLGAFNVGINGTYYLNRRAVSVTGQVPTDPMHTTISIEGIPPMEGVNTQPRMRYRTRVGWANGTWSITAFFNYRTHYWTNAGAPPNVNNQCQSPGGTIGGGGVDPDGTGPLPPLPGPYPCAITGYQNDFPPIHWTDLSIGYDTGDRPANEYLRNIGFQIVVQNLFDRHPPYAYATGVRPGAWATGQQGGANEINGLGRTISMILTKEW